MAVYFLRSKHFSRGKGSRVTRAAAYRAGERIRDERTGEVYNYADRLDVAYKEVVLPSDLAGRADMSWTQDRATLWNAAEQAARRCNSRLARELLAFVPPELSPAQRAHLVRAFSQELADRYRCAVDVAIHTPRSGADRRNHHAHLLMTVREVTPDGLGARTSLELGGRERRERGLGPTKDEYLSIRQRWAELTNDALHRAGLAARVDHRSLKAQGLNREPTPTIPEKVFYAERRAGGGSIAGDSIRARHRERLAARLQGGDELDRVLQRQKEQLRQRAIENRTRKATEPGKARWSSLTREERNAIRREQYRMRREIESQDQERVARRREASRQKYHASFRNDPEAMRQRRREYRKTHAKEINRKQREYRKANAKELNRRRREYRRVDAQEESAKGQGYQTAPTERSTGEIGKAPRSGTPQEAAQSWLTARQATRPEQGAGHSAEEWKSYRERKEPEATAANSAREWLAKREGQMEFDTGRSPETESPREDRDDEAGRSIGRRRDYDLER